MQVRRQPVLPGAGDGGGNQAQRHPLKTCRRSPTPRHRIDGAGGCGAPATGNRRKPVIAESHKSRPADFVGAGTTVRPKQGRERVRGWTERTMFQTRRAGSGNPPRGLSRFERQTNVRAAIRPLPGNAIAPFFPNTAMSYGAQRPVAGSRHLLVAALADPFSPA